MGGISLYLVKYELHSGHGGLTPNYISGEIALYSEEKRKGVRILVTTRIIWPREPSKSTWYNPADMSPETSTTKLCPTCGTRLSENATRCLVCGTELTSAAESKTQKAVQGSRMPEITLSLPAALGLLVLFVVIGAVIVFLGLRTTGRVIEPTAVPTATNTPTVTLTPTEASTSTPQPTATPEPPIDYVIKSGDFCGTIAFTFGVSVSSIIAINPSIDANCTNLVVGSTIKIPRPTPTVTPPATSTLEPLAATRAACQQISYIVQSGDTLSKIAANYRVPEDAIKSYNGLSTDQVFLGLPLIIPLCEREATPGPTPTPTNPPPYPAPNLLLPTDGSAFTLANDTITLQWASVGTLRDNERYLVVVEDVTDGQGRKLSEYVTDTKFIVPASFRPSASAPHIYRWTVTTVRQTSTDDQGQPIYSSAGATSTPRVFSWQGVAPEATKAP
jgi:LysM repeat protein